MLKATNGTDNVYYTRGFELISRREGAAASYYLFDGSLSVRALTDETGAVTDTLVFDAFGNETESTGTTSNTYGFQGEEKDATGLYYLRARYMDPASGTFTSMDTYAGRLSDPVSLHKYLFANSNPVMYSDPSGCFSLVEFELSEAIDEIIMSSLSFGMAYIGMVKDNPNMSDTEKFAGYLSALGLGVLFPFGLALIHALFSILVAGYVLSGLSLILSLISQGIDYEKHPTVVALLKISSGAIWASALSCLGTAFAQNARKADELIHVEANKTNSNNDNHSVYKESDKGLQSKGINNNTHGRKAAPKSSFSDLMSKEEATRYDEYWQRNAPQYNTPNSRIDYYKDHNGVIEKYDPIKGMEVRYDFF